MDPKFEIPKVPGAGVSKPGKKGKKGKRVPSLPPAEKITEVPSLPPAEVIPTTPEVLNFSLDLSTPTFLPNFGSFQASLNTPPGWNDEPSPARRHLFPSPERPSAAAALPALNLHPTADPPVFIPKWEYRSCKESQESKDTKAYVRSLFTRDDGLTSLIPEAKIMEMVENIPKFRDVWNHLLIKRTPKQAMDTIRGECRHRGNGKFKVPLPKNGTAALRKERGLRPAWKEYFRATFGGSKMTKKRLTAWLESRNWADAIWTEVYNSYGADRRKASQAIIGFLNNELNA